MVSVKPRWSTNGDIFTLFIAFSLLLVGGVATAAPQQQESGNAVAPISIRFDHLSLEEFGKELEKHNIPAPDQEMMKEMVKKLRENQRQVSKFSGAIGDSARGGMTTQGTSFSQYVGCDVGQSCASIWYSAGPTYIKSRYFDLRSGSWSNWGVPVWCAHKSCQYFDYMAGQPGKRWWETQARNDIPLRAPTFWSRQCGSGIA